MPVRKHHWIRQLTIWDSAVELVQSYKEPLGQRDGVKYLAAIAQRLLLSIDILKPLLASSICRAPECHRIAFSSKVDQGQTVAMLRFCFRYNVLPGFRTALAIHYRFATTDRALDVDVFGGSCDKQF